jgi:4-amino-4-deoxy-L-arabinose transferase-like glycosyltransferase
MSRAVGRFAFVLVAILAFSALVRTVALDVNPPGLFIDEAALGVNAKSLAQTGRSLKGDVLPLYVHEATFERWGLKSIVYQPLYQYALVPFVAVLGLSPMSVRLASVAFGLLGIAASYWLAKTLFDARTGLLTAALLALSPLHFQYSRIAFEAISLTVFLASGSALLFQGLERPRRLVVGAAMLALATYAYPAARLFAPLLALGFVAIHRDRLGQIPVAALAALSTAVLIGLPNLYALLTDPHQGRMQQLLIFTADIGRERAVHVLENWSTGHPVARFTLGHRPLLLAFVFVFNYLTHFSPVFLFLQGDSNLRHSPRGVGMYLPFVAPLLVVGLIWIFRNLRDGRHRFLLWWFLIWPLPSCLNVDSPHATRAFVVLPVVEIIAALGLTRIAAVAREPRGDLRRSWKAPAATAALVAILLAGVATTANHYVTYFGRYPVYAARAWGHGMRDALRKATAAAGPGAQVLVSARMLNAYLDILFFTDADFRRVPAGPRGPLPPGFTVVWDRKDAQGYRNVVWLVHADEREEHPNAGVVDAIPWPDGTPHLLILRETAR